MSGHEPRSDSKAQVDTEDDDQETLQPGLPVRRRYKKF
jgi:hypothetical protein